MRSLIAKLASVCIICSLSAVASAQSANQPGQLADARAERVSLPSGASELNGPELPTGATAQVPDNHDRARNRVWIASMFAALGGSAFDAASSWQKREANPLLASGGVFGAKAAALKGGFAAGLIIPQILLRKQKDWKSAFTIGNFAEAGIFSGIAAHNLTVRTTSH